MDRFTKCVAIKIGRSTAQIIADLRNLYRHQGPAATIEDMDRAVGEMFAHDRTQE